MARIFKLLKCTCIFVLVLILCVRSTTAGRGLKPIAIAREAFEVQFRREAAEENRAKWSNDQPERATPAGPDQHHHV